MIDRCRGIYPVRLMCRCLQVSSGGYYAWKSRTPGPRACENAQLLEEIRSIHMGSDQVLGSRRIAIALRRSGWRIGKNRVARLMRLEGLRGIPVKRARRAKRSGTRPDGVANRLRRDFAASAANRTWVTDITYVRTGEGWLYLCIVKDLYDGSIVGWSTGSTQESHLVIQAVMMALWQRPVGQPVVLHSDRGTQFTSEEYQQFLADHAVISSMSRVGSCADNASAESFFGQLKRERVNRRRYATRAEARSDIFDYIERFYNAQKRIDAQQRHNHSSALSELST